MVAGMIPLLLRRPQRAVQALCLLAACSAAQADNLLTVWRAAQARDSAYLSARQTLVFAQQRPSPVRLQLAQERLRMAEQDLALRAARAYFATLVARQDADVALEQLGTMALQLRAAQRSAEAGNLNGAELREAQAGFEQARAQRVAATRELEKRRTELGYLAGRQPEALAGLRADAAPWAPDPPDPAFWTALARDAHPQVRLQQVALEAASGDVARQRDSDTTNIDITASRARIFSDGSLSTPAEMVVRSRSAQLGLVLTLPLDEADADSRLREAMVARDKSEAGLAATQGAVVAQAQQAWSGVTQALSRIPPLAEAVRVGRNAVEALQASLRSGARLPPAAFQSAQRFYLAERDWFKARVDTVLQGLQLKAAAGTLAERDMASVNALLGPVQPPQAQSLLP